MHGKSVSLVLFVEIVPDLEVYDSTDPISWQKSKHSD